MPRETSTGSPDADTQTDVKDEPGQDRGNSSALAEQAEAQVDSGGSKDPKEANGDLGAGYGTRSRNRSGQSRPNYAEDKDIENDVYDFYNDPKDGDAKRPSRQSAAAAANGEVTSGSNSTRKATTAATDDTKATVAANGVKESNTAGTSGTSASSTTQSSRKRKAPAAANASQANSGSTSVATRRGAQATQTASTAWPETNLLTFENCKARPQNGRMVADDGTVLEANDHVYLVCEPPGEPYYLGRIMEFLHAKNDSTRPVDALRINWYYRPKDIGRKVTDTRLVFATMHSDISPLTALRGKCQIRHRAEIPNMDEYRKTSDSFWFEKLYDRYIQKNYDLIPTPQIVNVPDKVKKVLDDRWKYVLVEQGRGKELTSAVKLCKRCSSYCASNDSVDCAVCHNTYHMNCVKPPLLKKPSRGFAWSCAACSRAQERKLEARHTPNVTDPHADVEDEEMLDEEEDDMHAIETELNSPADGDDHHHQGTAEQVYQASLWPYRYLGMHCKPEDALDYDDRIYPRASIRLGPRHQAVVGPWTGEPAPLAKPESRRWGKKDSKVNKDNQSGQDSDKGRKGKGRKGAQDQSMICYERGGDPNELDPTNTSTLIWKPPPSGDPSPEEVEDYMDKARQLSDKLKLPKNSTNLQDVALDSYCRNDYDADKALKTVQKVDREEFKEPTLTPAELKKFEEAIEKYGSELQAVRKHVKSLKPGTIVRFYYTWKKTPRGRQIWDSHSTRKSKKEAKKLEAEANKLADDVADPDDDSAFDSNKAAERKRAFLCQFCSTTTSRQWRRAPSAIPGLVTETGAKATSKDKGPQYVMALCRRCAELWRRYAIRWEDMDEVAKKVAQSGGKAWKRKQDEELLKELQAARELGMATPDERPSTPLAVPSGGVQEPPRKKLKGIPDKDGDLAVSDGGNASGPGAAKKKDKVEASIVPEMPKPRILPCAVCDEKDPPEAEPGNQHVTCRECRLTVHRHCYGIMEQRGPGKWLCDMCTNDKNPQVSIRYKCVLCPIEHTEHEFVEQPKLTHHKKKMSDKDREREKLEVQQARKAVEQYRKRQEELNRPVNPREPLKRTADNNWVHVTCAVWTPEVKFGNARAIEPSEGIPSIPRARYEETCQACHATNGATISCHQCRMNFHVECARQHGHVLGFEVTPVKSSRRDQMETVSINGIDGVLTARLWCKNHLPTKTTVIRINEQVKGADLNALQVYVQTYKQADLTLTGTVRKANLMAAASKLSGVPTSTQARRQSTITGTNGNAKTETGPDSQTAVSQSGQWVCISCGIDVSPKWWPIDHSQERELTNGHYGTIGSEARKYVEQRKFQCHRCRKTNRTPKPHAAPPPAPSAAPPASQVPYQEPVDAAMASSSPHHGHRAMHSDPRDPRPVSRGWASRAHSHSGGPPPAAPAHQPSTHAGPEYPSPRALPPRPAYAGGPYQSGPVGPVHSDWPPRPGSQHGSPPQHVNGGPPPLHSGPPPLSGLGSLRPPPLSGLLPPGPISGSPHHGMGPQPYMNGMPPSPRRHSGGPAPPSPYIGPYATGSSHLPPPPRNGPHSLNNGGPPPPPMRNDGYPSGMGPQRDPRDPRDPRGMPLPRAAYPAPHASPPGSRSGLPPPHEPSPRSGSIPPRGSEPRPASGASASPSLRNLLS